MVNFITKLPVVAGKDAILVVCDQLSKIAHFVATIEGTSAEGLARLFRDNMLRSLTVDFILFSLFIFILLYFSFSFSFFYF